MQHNTNSAHVPSYLQHTPLCSGSLQKKTGTEGSQCTAALPTRLAALAETQSVCYIILTVRTFSIFLTPTQQRIAIIESGLINGGRYAVRHLSGYLLRMLTSNLLGGNSLERIRAWAKLS